MSNDSSGVVVATLRALIANAAPGEQLPSTRELVARHRVSPVTVQRALRSLTAAGLIESRPGVGTFVRRARSLAPTDFSWQTAALRAPVGHASGEATPLRSVGHDVIALHSGYPDRSLLPERLVRTSLTRSARSEAPVGRPPLAGLPELQSWFAHEVAGGIPAGLSAPSAGDVVITPGSQSALASIFRALAGPGESIVLESPTYWGAIQAAKQAGIRAVPVPTGADGPDPEDVRRAFQESGARAIYVQPNFANPTGVQWSSATSKAVLEVARDSGAFVIEDDWAHDFGIEATSTPLIASDSSGHVIHLRSLTKSVAPALRIAVVIARGPARERIVADVAATAMYVSGVLQAAALDVVTQPAWRTHLRGLRSQLGARRDLLIDSLTQHAPTVHLERVPRGGLNLWARLPDSASPARVAAECERRGLIVGVGDEWFPAEPSGKYLRLNFSGPNPSAFPDAARILGEALA